MQRILAGLFVALFLGALAAESLHRHADPATHASCAVCAATAQARQLPAAAPAPAQDAGAAAIAAEPIPAAPSGTDVTASARAPPSVA